MKHTDWTDNGDCNGEMVFTWSLQFMYVCVCVCVCARARVRACVRACVRVFVLVDPDRAFPIKPTICNAV